MSEVETGLDSSGSNRQAASGEPYRVLARKYRPFSFSDLIGQEPMVRTLTNAFETGRIAQAWMLTGVRGVGKTTTARILARALNYETDEIHQPTIHMETLGEHCRAVMEGRHVDVVEMDAASHTGIDDVREIIAQVRYRPVSARYKVYIIDEVHMLSTQAFNGLLKTLEEPPEHVKFVFATTEIRKVPITVLSRCQRFDLRRIETDTLMAHLAAIAGKEGFSIEEEALRLIARAGEGSVRDALSLTDQALAHGGGAVTGEAVRDMLGLADRGRVIDLFDLLMAGDGPGALAAFRDQYNAGADPAVVLADLADFTHLVTTLRYVPDSAGDASLSPAESERGLALSKTLSIRTLGQVWQMLLKGLEEVRNANAPRQAAEMALIRVVHAAHTPSPEDLIRLLKDGGTDALPAPARSDDPGGAGASDAAVSSQAPGSAARADGVGGSAPAEARSMGGGSGLAPRAMHDAAPAASPFPEPAPAVAISSLADLLALAVANRDSLMAARIRRYIRPGRFQPGRVEIGLIDEAPKALVNDLHMKLRDWTGERWTVTIASDATGPTLDEAAATARRELLTEAERDPDVAAVLRAFPGARITDVRLRGAPDDTSAADDDAAPLSPGFDDDDMVLDTGIEMPDEDDLDDD